MDQLLDAVTSEMIHVDNLANDLNNVLKMKITRDKRKKLEAIRNETLAEFRTQVKEHIEQDLKPKLNVSFICCFYNYLLIVSVARTLRGV
jgi:uncharacterized protein YnzC (UPF0291/DUF896 family)